MNMHKQITTSGGLSIILVTFMLDRITSGYTTFKKVNGAHLCRRLKMFSGNRKKTASECLHDHVFDWPLQFTAQHVSLISRLIFSTHVYLYR